MNFEWWLDNYEANCHWNTRLFNSNNCKKPIRFKLQGRNCLFWAVHYSKLTPFCFKKGVKHLRIKIPLSSDGKLHYKVVITQCSLCNVHISLCIYLSKRPIYVTQLTLSEINTILSKNFCFVTLTRTLDREFLFSPFPPPPLPDPPSPSPLPYLFP